MRRWKKHVGNLNRILKDDRISGSRRMLGQALAMWLDADEEERRILDLVLIGTFGPTSKRIWWKDDDEEGVAEPENTRIDIETRAKIKDAFAFVMGEETTSNALPKTDIHMPGSRTENI
jgi:hypothetical protein